MFSSYYCCFYNVNCLFASHRLEEKEASGDKTEELSSTPRMPGRVHHKIPLRDHVLLLPEITLQALSIVAVL